MFQRIAGKQQVPAVGKQVGQGQVDRPHRAMEVDRPKQLGPHRDEPHQRRQAAVVDRQPLAAEEAVVQQPVEIERPRAVARHVGVAEHEVHVVDRVDAAEQAAQQPQPARLLLVIALARPGDQQGDLLRIERLAVRQPLVGIAAQLPQQRPNSRRMICAAERFVGQAVMPQEMLVEEMAERPVPHVVQQAGHPHQRLDVARGWARRGRPRAGCRTAPAPPGWPGASPPARAGTACARPWERPTRRSATGGSAAAAAPRDGR